MISKVKKNPTDPAAILVGGIIEILAALEIPAKLGLSGEQVAQIGGAIIMIAAALRFMFTKHDSPAAQVSGGATPQEVPDDKETPVVGPPPTTDG